MTLWSNDVFLLVVHSCFRSLISLEPEVMAEISFVQAIQTIRIMSRSVFVPRSICFCA